MRMNDLTTSYKILLQRPTTDAMLLCRSNTVLTSQRGQCSIQRAVISLFTYIPIYVGRSSRNGTFKFTGIKRDASVAVLQVVVSVKCVLLLIGSAHVSGQSRDR